MSSAKMAAILSRGRWVKKSYHSCPNLAFFGPTMASHWACRCWVILNLNYQFDTINSFDFAPYNIERHSTQKVPGFQADGRLTARSWETSKPPENRHLGSIVAEVPVKY